MGGTAPGADRRRALRGPTDARPGARRGRGLAGGASERDDHDRYALRADDGALIYISTHGVRVASPETAARLVRGAAVDPSEYYFRIHATLETGAPDYYWLNERIFVASVVRHFAAVVYDLYAVT